MGVKVFISTYKAYCCPCIILLLEIKPNGVEGVVVSCLESSTVIEKKKRKGLLPGQRVECLHI